MLRAFRGAPAGLTAAPPTRVRHWVVGLATVMAFLLYLDRNCLALLVDSITADLALTDDQTGWLLSAFFWTYALAQVPSGWLSDRFGARRMLALYIVLWSLFTGLMGVAASLSALLVLRLGVGLAQAGAYPTSAGLVSKWVPFSGRGLASGLISTGGRVGGAAAQSLTALLLAGFAGAWRPVLILYGAAGLLVAGVFWLLVRDRPREHPACSADEMALIEHGRPAGTTNPHGRVQGLPVRYLLRSRSLWLSSLSQFGTNFGWVFLISWLPTYLEKVHKVPLVERGQMAALPIFVGMAGMLAGGWLTDQLTRRIGVRWGRRLPMALTRFVAMAAFLACTVLESAWTVTLALCVVAVATDLGTASVWAFKQDVGGRHVGSVLGWGNMWGNLGAALSPVVLNWLARRGSWDASFLACAAAFLVAGVAAMGVDATVPIVPPEEAGESAQGSR